jgi:hypothetical protein
MAIAIKVLMLSYVKEYCKAKKLTTTSFPKSVVGNPLPEDYKLSFVKFSTNWAAFKIYCLHHQSYGSPITTFGDDVLRKFLDRA